MAIVSGIDKLQNDSPITIGPYIRKSTGTLQEIKGNFGGISEIPLRNEVTAILVTPMAKFGETIRRLRKARYLSAAELGTAVGVVEKQVLNWEKLVTPTLQGKNYRKLAEALGLTTDQLDREWRAQNIEQSIGDPIRRGIPLINKAPAGSITDYHEHSMIDSGQGAWYVSRDGIEDPHAFAVVVVGDSMKPTLVNGAVAVFSPMSPDGHTLFKHLHVPEGHVVFVRFGPECKNEGCTIARLHRAGGRVRLMKDNKKFPDINCGAKDIVSMAAMIRHDDLPGMTKTFQAMEQLQSKGEKDKQREGQLHPDHENPNEKHPEET